VIHYLTPLCDSNPHAVIAYFYFTFTDTKKQTKEGFLRSVIRQLCGSRPDIPDPVSQLYRRLREQNHEPDQESLEKALNASVRDFSHVFLVLDGLDEVPTANGERRGLMELLVRIRNWALPSLHLLMTSRFELEIDRGIRRMQDPSRPAVIDLNEQKEINHDIQTFVALALAATEFEDWPKDMVEEATARLLERADGM